MPNPGVSQETLFRGTLRAAAVTAAAVLLWLMLTLSAPAQAALPVGADSFNTLVAAGNGQAQGITSDGTTMWAADSLDNKIYAYRMDTKAHDSAKDFNTLGAAGNTGAGGIWQNGSHMWVVDVGASRVFAYRIDTKARDSSQEIGGLNTDGNFSPYGVYSDGTTMWVGDAAAQRLMAYRMDTKARDAAKDFSSLGFAPAGFHADATHMWINDRTNNRVVAFRLDTRTLDSSRGAGLTGINGNRGLHVENGIAWASFQNAGITAYVMAEPCNPAANPPTALGSALGTAPGATLSISGSMPSDAASVLCVDSRTGQQSAYFTLEIPAGGGGAVRVSVDKDSSSTLYPELLVREVTGDGADRYTRDPLFYDTLESADGAAAAGTVAASTSYVIQLRARDVVSRAGRGTGGGYALRVERIRPAFLRMSYVDGNLEAYWDTGVYEGRPLFAGAVQSCTGYFRNCRYGTAAIVTQYNVNGGSWEEHQAGDPAKPPPDINSSIAQATKAVAGIVAGDRLAFRARYATSQDDYAQSLLQTFYGEIRLPAPTDLTLQKRMLENEIMTYQITAQWSAPEFSGDSLGDLNWHYLMQLNENDAFTVSSGSGRNLEESFLWRESGLLQVQVRTSVTCTSTGDPCEEVDYGTGSYSIPAGATWLSTWSEPGVINLEAQSGGPVGEPVVVADPDALVIGLIYVGMDIFDYERDENIAITFSLLLCLGLAIGGAYFILRKMKQNLMGVMTAAAYFMFIFVGMGLVLFGVPPGLVVVMVAAPVIIFGLIFIRRLAL